VPIKLNFLSARFPHILALTIFLTMFDYYLLGVPIKIYYLPPLLLVMILLQKRFLHIRINARIAVLLSTYMLIILLSFLMSDYKYIYGMKSPLIFLLGILVDIGIFYLFFEFYEIKHTNVLLSALVVSVMLNTICAISLGTIGNIIHTPIGKMLAVVNSNYLRPAGFSAEPDVFGFYVSTIALFILPHIQKRKLWKIDLLTISFLAYTFMNIVSITRTSLLSEIIAVFYMFIIKGKWGKVLSIFTVVLFVFVIFSAIGENNPIFGRFSKHYDKTDSGAFNSRLITIYMTIDYIKGKWLTGNGPGYLDDIARNDETLHRYASGGEINTNRNGTIYPLGELFNTGALGLCIVTVILIWIWRVLSIKSSDPRQENILLGARLVLLNSIIVSMANTVIKMPFIWILLAIGCKVACEVRSAKLFCTEKKRLIPSITKIKETSKNTAFVYNSGE
jgi:hypothetical protein